MERTTESDLEVEAPTGLQVAPQPDENKYYIGGGGSDHPLFVPPDQSDQSQVKRPGHSKATWVLTVITVACLALALGGGLGGGLHKSSLSSHASIASTEASHATVTIIPTNNAPVTIIQTSGAGSIASSPSQQSNLSTSTSIPPSPITPTAPPNPSQTSSNDKGSSSCSFLDASTCQTAYSQYNDTYLYKARATYILPSIVNSVATNLFSSADTGCAAIFACDSEADFAVGMMGAQIKAAFDFLYQNQDDSVKICGSSYLSNGCHVTVNACEDCVPAVPCGSLSAENIAKNYPCET